MTPDLLNSISKLIGSSLEPSSENQEMVSTEEEYIKTDDSDVKWENKLDIKGFLGKQSQSTGNNLSNNQSEGVCQTSILDVSIRKFLKDWPTTILEIVDEIMDLGKTKGDSISNNNFNQFIKIVNNSQRLIYLGLTFILLALILFYLEISS